MFFLLNLIENEIISKDSQKQLHIQLSFPVGKNILTLPFPTEHLFWVFFLTTYNFIY